MQGDDPCKPWSFVDFMNDARDAAASRPSVCKIPSRVVRSRPKLRIDETTDQVAARLSSTPRRVRALCYQGRIEGAFQQRSRVGKPWKIPAHLQPDGTYKVKVKSGARGPALRAVSGLVRLNQVPF